jgi:DNA-binding GntR family transcriptional regulator
MELSQLAEKLALPPRISTTDYTLQILRQAILEGIIQAGQPIRQEDVAKQLDVSRMPIREALIKLEGEGLVVFHQNRGAVVAELSADEAEELYEIRIALETTALRLAFPHLNETDLARAERIIGETDQEDEVGRWGEQNWAFHETLYRPAGRFRLLDMIYTLHINVDRYLRMQMSVMRYKERSQQEHRQLVEACRTGDLGEALRILEQHIQAAGETLVKHLRNEETGE